MYQSQLKATGEEMSQAQHNAAWRNVAGHDAAFAGLLVTTVKLVFTTRVGSNGITTIMLYSKMPFNEAFEALMTLRASIGRF